jgi:transposase
MRAVALGRKNWLHIGSPQAGPRVAAILSIVGTSRRLKLPVRNYLGTILPGLGDYTTQLLPDLTPVVWVAVIYQDVVPAGAARLMGGA